MTKQQLIEKVSNNPKFEDLTILHNMGAMNNREAVGFKLNRKNSLTYFWFDILGDEAFFSHSYSQRTGKKSYSYKSCRNLLWEIGYFG